MRKAWVWFKNIMRPPVFVPQYGVFEFLAEDQRALDRGMLLGISPEGIEKGHAAVAEKYNELLAEATRLVEREVRLAENAQKLHTNVIQFSLIAAGIVAALGEWLNLYAVWLPLLAFIASIAGAWWILWQRQPDWFIVAEKWGQNVPKKVGETEVPENLRKEMHLHLYERIFYMDVRSYRLWLHQLLIVPVSFFMLGLMLLLFCVVISR